MEKIRAAIREEERPDGFWVNGYHVGLGANEMEEWQRYYVIVAMHGGNPGKREPRSEESEKK